MSLVSVKNVNWYANAKSVIPTANRIQVQTFKMTSLSDYYYVIFHYQYYQPNTIPDKGKDELIIYESKYDKSVNIFIVTYAKISLSFKVIIFKLYPKKIGHSLQCQLMGQQ